MPAPTIFCRFCGISDVRKFGNDARRRQRYQCLLCRKIFTQRTRTFKSGSHLSDAQWDHATRCFCKRAGESAADLARTMEVNRKTAQKLNRTFRLLVKSLEPTYLPGHQSGMKRFPQRSGFSAVFPGSSSNACCKLFRIVEETHSFLSWSATAIPTDLSSPMNGLDISGSPIT